MLAAEEEPAARAKGPILGERDRLASKSRHREEWVWDLIVQLHQAATKADLAAVVELALDRRNSDLLPKIREVLQIFGEPNSRLATAGAPTNGTQGPHLKLVPPQPPCGPN